MWFRYCATTEATGGGMRGGSAFAHAHSGRRSVLNRAAQLHGWNVQPAVNAGGTKLTFPFPVLKSGEEMRAIDAKLDAFVKRYKG